MTQKFTLSNRPSRMYLICRKLFEGFSKPLLPLSVQKFTDTVLRVIDTGAGSGTYFPCKIIAFERKKPRSKIVRFWVSRLLA